MVRPTIVDPLGQSLRISPIVIHSPDRRRLARGRAAEEDALAIRRFAGPEIPDTLTGCGELACPPRARIPSTDPSSAAREFRFVIAIEMICVRSLGLVLPRHLGPGKSLRKQHLAVTSPGWLIRSAAPGERISISGSEPQRLTFGEHSVLAPVRPSDAKI